MKLRLWANWDAAGGEPIQGYHLEVDRAYARVPTATESIQLPQTRYGTSKPVIEHVYWEADAVPNLLLGTWEEAGGSQLGELTEAGFHQSGDAGCHYCARR